MGSIDDYRPEDLSDVVYEIWPTEEIGVTMGPFGSWVCTCENCEASRAAARQRKPYRHDRTHPGMPERKKIEVKEWETDSLDPKPEEE